MVPDPDQPVLVSMVNGSLNYFLFALVKANFHLMLGINRPIGRLSSITVTFELARIMSNKFCCMYIGKDFDLAEVLSSLPELEPESNFIMFILLCLNLRVCLMILFYFTFCLQGFDNARFTC